MLSRDNDLPNESDPLNGFAAKFGLISGLLGVGCAAVGVWFGLSGDAVLGEARVELAVAGGITVAALAILVAASRRPLLRATSMGAAALAYHLTLSRRWLPWIEHYRSHVATGLEHQVWEEAVALPLLMIGGLFMVVSAIVLWPGIKPRQPRTR
jgi:hypothetical protein